MIYTLYSLSLIQLSYLRIPLIINVKQPKYCTVFILLRHVYDLDVSAVYFCLLLTMLAKGCGLCPCRVLV